MFKDLRPNIPFYIFEKGNKISFQIGTVIAVSAPQVKQPTTFNGTFPTQPEYIVNIQVKTADGNITFEKLPANGEISYLNNDAVVISPKKDLIKTEIENTLSNSKTIIDTLPIHENNVIECEKILQELNPSFAKEKEQEEELKRLREQVASMEQKLGSLDEIKEMILSQSKNSNNNSKK